MRHEQLRRTWLRYGDRPAALVLGAIFLYSTLIHLQNPFSFLRAVYQYDLVTVGVGFWVAVLIPWFQMTVGVSMLLAIMSSATRVYSVLLTGCFTVVHASAWARGIENDCGCFSPVDQVTTGGKATALAAVLLAVSVVRLLVQPSDDRPSSTRTPHE